jgi:lysophospholipase L1-like esterase
MKQILFATALCLSGGSVNAAEAPPWKTPSFANAVATDPLPGAGPFTSRPPYQAQYIAGFAKRQQIDQQTVVFLGDSITEWWTNFGKAFPNLRVANRGIASDTTRGMLCRLQESVLVLNPQAVVIAGGINDLRPANNPPGTPETVAGNVKLMLAAIQKHDPKVPVLVCEILPSGIGTPETITATNQAVDKVVADFPQAVRVKTHAKFLSPDGTQNKALFTDTVHLKPEGYAVWQSVLSQEFEKLGLKRINTAVIPATQSGNGYNWMERHNAILKAKSETNPDLVFIGDSISHFWGGNPSVDLTPNDKNPRVGDKVLKKTLSDHRVLNLGFGSDRTQQALWRLDHGELEGLKPKWVVINIGTNNTSDGNNADEILAGIQAVCERVKKQTPEAKIILMAIFPRDNPATSPRRKLIDDINRQLADYARNEKFTWLDIHAKFLDEHGLIPKALMPDLCHPVESGYQIWADALLPLLK